MPKGIPNARHLATDAALEPFGGKGDHDGDGHVGGSAPARSDDFELYAEVPKAKMVPIELLRNYQPFGAFEIIGWNKPAVKVKNAAGKETVLEPATMVPGVAAPPPQAGVGYDGKLWAGTLARFTTEEAKHIRANGIGEIDIED